MLDRSPLSGPGRDPPPLVSLPEVERCRSEEGNGNSMNHSGGAWEAGVIPGQRLDDDGDPEDPQDEKRWLRCSIPAALVST